MNYTISAITAVHLMPRIGSEIRAMLAEGAVTVTFRHESKSREVERKYHAMISDIAKQVSFFGKKYYSAEVWKALLIEQFAQDRAAMGEPLSQPAQTITSLDGQRLITVRPSSTQFSKKEASDFVEFLYSQGAEMGVAWSDPEILSMAESYIR